MKKFNYLLIAICLVLCLITACSGNNQQKDINVNTVYSEIENTVTVPDFIELSDSDISDYINVNPSDIKQMVVKISAEAISADQIIICEAIDSEAADKIESAFNTYLDSVKKSFENYLPSEYAKMKDTSVQRSGNYIYYAVSEEHDVIENIFDKYFK